MPRDSGSIMVWRSCKSFNNENRKPTMYFHSSLMVPIALFLLSGLIGSAAEAAVTAPHEIPVLSGMTPEKIYLAAGTKDKDEEDSIGDPDEQAAMEDPGENATIGDPGEQATVGDPGEQATVGDPGEKAGIGDPGERARSGDPGERATIGDPGEKSSF